jgi:hypothetical protein
MGREFTAIPQVSPPSRGGDQGEGERIRPENFFHEFLRRDIRISTLGSPCQGTPPDKSFDELRKLV